MEWQQLIMDIFTCISKELEQALDGLSVDDLNQQPSPDCNSIGWLTWHLTREQDRIIGEVMSRKQLWVRDNWCIRFNRAPDPSDTGFGHSSEDAAAFVSPDSRALLEYHRAVLEQSKQYFSNKLSETDLKRRSKSPTLARTNMVRGRLVGVINDNLQHTGQVAYLRGLLKGTGWLGR